MRKSYQQLFNELVTYIRIAINSSVSEDSPLLKTVIKQLYNFSDALSENGIVTDRNKVFEE